jgi:hypothetical protein
MPALFAILIVLCIVAIIFSGAGKIMLAKLRPEPPGADDVPLPFLIFPTMKDAPSSIPMPVVRGGTAKPMELGTSRAGIPIPSAIARASPAETNLTDLPDGATVVFRQPSDEPIQLLPGRLELLKGEDEHKEFRLVSTLGERPKIVVGRGTGPPHHHITLHSPTVSRQHAELEFADGHWTITNLSDTNPVLVNDAPVSFSGSGRGIRSGTRARVLSDGDRIAMGEVLLRFHAR